MQIISVNIGQERPIQGASKSGRTGIFKEPTLGPVVVTPLGLAGDAVVDRKNHGGPDQAVYVYTLPDYAWWSETVSAALAPGTFGENLTLSALESAALAIGDVLRAGEVVLQVTAPRIPCATLSARMGDRDFLRRFRDARRPGFYCRVLQPGTLQVGDPVALEPYTGETVTVGEMFDDYYQPRADEAVLRRYLNAPVAIRARVDKENQLNRLRSGG